MADKLETIQNEIFNAISSTPGIGVIGYDKDGIIQYFDSGAEKLFDYRAEFLIGHACYEVIHEANEFARYFNSGLLDQPQQWESKVDCLTRMGETLPCRVTLNPAQTDELAWVAVYQQRSDEFKAECRANELQKRLNGLNTQSEKEAQFLRELLGSTMEVIQIGLAVHEYESGMIAYVNDGFRETTGLRQIDVMGQTWDSVLQDYPEARDNLTNLLQVLKVSKPGRITAPARWEVDLPTGRKAIEVYGRVMELPDHPTRYLLLVIEDHTDRHRLQVQLVQSEKLAAVGQLAAGIAHELRNPLSTIFHALYDMNEILQPKKDDVAEDIEICMAEIKRVQDIITNLLDFAREGESSYGQANLVEVIDMTVRLVRHDLTNKSINLDYHVETEKSEVAVSSNALKQILINLITNSVQAMSSGGKLTISVVKQPGPVPTSPAGSGPITTETDESIRMAKFPVKRIQKPGEAPYHIALTVSDNGHGIPAAVMPHIFNPFFTTKEPGKGTGLGLSVVHALVDDSGGAITVESVANNGTRITLQLPIPHSDDD